MRVSAKSSLLRRIGDLCVNPEIDSPIFDRMCGQSVPVSQH